MTKSSGAFQFLHALFRGNDDVLSNGCCLPPRHFFGAPTVAARAVRFLRTLFQETNMPEQRQPGSNRGVRSSCRRPAPPPEVGPDRRPPNRGRTAKTRLLCRGLILVVPEDFRNDRHILKPLFSRLFRSIGRPRAKVDICRDPLPGGVNETLKIQCIGEIVHRYGRATDIFILCIDSDGNEGRRARLDDIEAGFRNDRAFHAVNAWEEIETWLLAGLKLPKGWRRKDVRAEIHVKDQPRLRRDRGLRRGLVLTFVRSGFTVRVPSPVHEAPRTPSVLTGCRSR